MHSKDNLKSIIISLFILCFIFSPPLKADPALEFPFFDPGLKVLDWDGCYAMIEDVYNFSGGLRSGSVFDAVGHIATTFDTHKAGWWTGGQFTVGLIGISESHNQYLYTGAIQAPSNLTAPNKILISDLAYLQTFNKDVSLRVGIMDVNEYIDAIDLSAGLLNSGFDPNQAMGSDFPVATYPYPGFGVLLDLKNDLTQLQLAIFQGNPQHQDTVFRDGYALHAELAVPVVVSKTFDNLFKFGGWHYQQSDPQIGFTNNGVYLSSELTWKNINGKQSGVFMQVSAAPQDVNPVPYYLSGGYNVNAPFACRPKDSLSLGFSRIWIQGQSQETVVEATYAIYLINHLILNPDLQYIFKPAGNLPNAFVGIIRLTYAL